MAALKKERESAAEDKTDKSEGGAEDRVGSKAKPKGRGELPDTPGNRAAIVALIEKKKGPVGKGHHESHRRDHLMQWLAQKNQTKK